MVMITSSSLFLTIHCLIVSALWLALMMVYNILPCFVYLNYKIYLKGSNFNQHVMKLHVRNIFETVCSVQLFWKLYCSFPLHLSRNLAYYGVKWVLKIKSCTYQQYFYNQFLTFSIEMGWMTLYSNFKIESFHANEKCYIIGLYNS